MGQLIGLLVLAGFLMAYWPWLLAGYLAWLAYQGHLEVQAENAATQAAQAAESARLVDAADREHAWIMADDERGIFGDFPEADGM